jgi:hypothetical protein
MQGPTYEPNGLDGNVIERLRCDPEVVETRRRLIRGLVVVAACIILAVFWDMISPWSARYGSGLSPAPPAVATQTAPASSRRENNVIGLVRPDAEMEESSKLPDGILFERADNEDESGGEASPPAPRQPPIRILVPSGQNGN